MVFSELVDEIKRDRKLDKEVPGFDEKNGNENAKFLFLMEAPGPKAVLSKSISLENNDPTAKNMCKQITEAGIERSEIALWNIVPWYVGKINESDGKTVIRPVTESDIKDSLNYLKRIIDAMPNLKCIILVGGAARKAHIFLSGVTTARIVSCHHTSIKVKNMNKDAFEENMKVLRFIKTTG